ncbi:hypothetical protein B0T18DRAFT_328817 [Schizothecium vesticola]|uniref:Uncharacterized protein n=1 Tax=Schizothecium vesticola TaxID=314040 RepID=A0AA40EQ43_9PEZI|nr:hypothetical protein B0T18DRAFT_328817 [Schizothecium vesticola]
MPLPHLTPLPARHPASCASLSLSLLSLLDRVLPAPPSLTLSIGSGPGLLEALFLNAYPARAAIGPIISLYGVEVASSTTVNRFLPERNALEVAGTWAVAREAEEARGLMFVYPRQKGLIQTYLHKGTGVSVVVWIGPRCDVEEMTEPLRNWGVEDGDICGEGLVEDGEAVLVFRKSDGIQT